MGPLVQFLAENGELLLIGVTALLAAGVVAMRLQRSPIHRQRLGELTVGCTLLWAVLACLPMARPLARRAEPKAAPPVGAPVRPTLPAPTRVVPARPVPGPATRPLSPIYFAETRSEVVPGSAPLHVSPGALARVEPLNAPAPIREDAATEVAAPGVEGPAVVAGTFVAGAALCGGWLGLGGLILRRMVRRAAGPPGWLVELFESLQGSGRRAPRLLVSRHCRRPVSCGVFRPTVVLPADAVAPENRAQLCQVLLHELGHVRQRDAWGNLLFNFALPVLYFHPLYWLARREVHLCRELIADDWAAARFGKESYVAELVALARTALGHGRDARSPWGSMGLFRSPTDFYRRMHMLIQRTNRLSTSCSRGWRFVTAAAFGCALAIAAGVAGLQPARAQDSGTVQFTAPPEASNATEVERSAPEREKEKGDKHVDELARRLAETQSALADTMKRLQAAQSESASAKEQQAQREGQIREHLDHLLAVQKQYQDLQTRAKHEVLRPDPLAAEDAVFDRFIAERLDEMKAHPDGVSDEEFVRRLYLDLIGTPPDPKVLDAFRSDTSPDKRERLLRELVQFARQRGAEAGAGGGLVRQNLEADTWPRAENPEVQVAGDPFARGLAAAGRAGGQIDLVTLAVNYIDAIGDIRTAEAQVQRTQQLVQRANATSLELELHKSALQTAQRKVQLLRGLIEIALGAARADYESATDMAKKGFVPQSQLAEARQRLQILELILKSGQ